MNTAFCRSRLEIRHGLVAVFCLIGHALLIKTAIWSAGTPETAKEYPPTAHMASTDGDEALQLIVLDDQTPSDRNQPKFSLPKPPDVDIRKALAQPVVLLIDPDVPREKEATVAEAGQLSKMYGRYLGQIEARVGRAWRRPRTPIGDSLFSCRTQITQDRSGHVLEVMLVQCNGDPHWQESLVKAIDAASPLPAPPDRAVFTDVVTMAFSAAPYSKDSVADEYESAR
jgi:TonB C terminal